MAVTADVVGVRMEADTTAYINNIRTAESSFLNSMKKMGAEAVLTGNASAVAFQKTSNAALKTAKDTQVLSTSMRNLNGTTGNVAAQFNDIGVSLAGGQSPLLVALQQGTQLNQVFQQLKEGGGGIGASLLGAFTQVLNPISLATIGIIALGGYAVQYFMSIFEEGEAANLTLKQQEQIIRAVADRWGDTIPALREYADELDRVKARAEDKMIFKIIEDDAFAVAKKELTDLQIEFADFFDLLREAGASDEIMVPIQNAFAELTDEVNKNGDATEELEKLQKALADAAVKVGIPAIDSFGASIAEFSEIALNAANNLAKFVQQQALAKANPLGQISPLFSEDGKFLSGDQFSPNNPPIPGDKPSQLGEYPNGGFTKGSGGGRTKKDTEDSYESFTRKIKDQTAAITAETEAQAKLNPLINDYGFAADAARLYQEGLNAAKKAGVELSPAEQEQLRLLTEGLALVRQEQTKLDEEQKKTKQSFEAWNETAKSAVGGLIDDMLSGASAAETLKNALGKVLDQLIEIGLNKVFDSKTGIISALFGAFTGGATGGGDPWAGKRANGGPVSAGKPYLVGERGMETFVPDRAGSIIPNTPNIGAPGGSGGGSVTVRTFMDENGDWQQRVENIAGNVAVKHVQRSQAGEISRLPGNLKAVNQRGMIKGK